MLLLHTFPRISFPACDLMFSSPAFPHLALSLPSPSCKKLLPLLTGIHHDRLQSYIRIQNRGRPWIGRDVTGSIFENVGGKVYVGGRSDRCVSSL